MPRAADATDTKHAWTRPVAAFVGCAIVYYAVLTLFLGIPAFNGETQVRPASGVGPVLGLFFGWPGILGCAFGNLVSDMASESDPLMLAVYTLIQVVYNAVPYFVWYLALRKSDDIYPSLASVKKVALYAVAMVATAAVVTLMLMPLEPDTMSYLDIHVVRFLNNALFLVYLGMPLLMLLELSPLEPHAPFFVDEPYVRPVRMNLTQRFLTGVILFAALMIAAEVSVSFYGDLMATDADYARLIDEIYINVGLLTFAVLMPAVVLAGALESRFTRPIERLTEASTSFAAEAVLAAHEGDASFDTKIDEEGIRPRYEVRDLYDATDKMRSDLVNYVGQLAEVTAERERVAAELDIARRIQLAAVPHDFCELVESSGLDIAGSMRPARMVGGDFYDVFEAGEGRVAFVVGDVSGKGVPAALFMMRAQGLLREQIMAQADMGAAFTAVNARLCDRNDENLFVTAFACVLDLMSGRVVFANAGHNPPLIVREGATEYFRPRPGLVLGAMDAMRYRQGEFTLAPGERLLVYTDGVTEAVDVSGALYGERRLEERVRHLMDGSAPAMQELIDGVIEDVDAFAGEAPQADDITLLGFARPACTDRIELDPDDTELDRLFAWLEPLCERPGTTPKMHASLMLVMEEIFVNTCHYGFPEGAERQPVVIEATADDGGRALTVTFMDGGIPYDPLTFDAHKVENADDARIGGLGILLVRKNLDDIVYRRVGDKNVLRMVKTYI